MIDPPSSIPADETAAALARLGGRVRWLVLLYLLALVLGSIASTLAWPGLLARQPALAGLGLDPGALDMAGRLAALAALMVPVLPMLEAVRQALALCGLMASGRLFTAGVPPRLKRMGMALIAVGALQPVGGALLALAVSSFVGGGRGLAIAFSSDYVGVAVIGAVLVAVAAAAREAVRLAEENSRFV